MEDSFERWKATIVDVMSSGAIGGKEYCRLRGGRREEIVRELGL